MKSDQQYHSDYPDGPDSVADDYTGFITRVAEFSREHDLFHDLERVVIGFSGGPDSTALLLSMIRLFPAIEAIHVHHGIRGTSGDRDRDWCEQFCQRHHIRLRSITIDVPGQRRPRESMEMAARRLRLQEWQQLYGSTAGIALALGHHLDDKIETFLLRLLRGSNASGLTGLRPITRLSGLKVIRPLLGVEKKDILRFLHSCRIAPHCEDESNLSTLIKRNQIRHHVLPHLLQSEHDKKGILQSLKILEADAHLIEIIIAEKIQSLKSAHGCLTKEILQQLPPGLWSRYLRRWQEWQTGIDEPLAKNTIMNLQRECSKSAKKPHAVYPFSTAYNLHINHGILTLESKLKHQQPCPTISWNWHKMPAISLPTIKARLNAKIISPAEFKNHLNRQSECWDVTSISENLTIRPRIQGDRIIPWGMNQSVRLKKIIANAKLSPDLKNRLFVITDDRGRIIWIPLVKRSNHGKVSSSTKQILTISIEQIL